MTLHGLGSLFSALAASASAQMLANDWDCTVSRGNVNGRYGDLGGGEIGEYFSVTANETAPHCDSNDMSFTISGSSTVFPVAKIWAIEFNQCYKGGSTGCATINVGAGGSGNGAEDVCDGSSDIGDMSRNWKDTEAFKYVQDNITRGCVGTEDNPVTVTQIPLGYDGITVFVSDNTLLSCIQDAGGLTLGELRWIYSSLSDDELEAVGSYVPSGSDGSDPRTWNELLPDCSVTSSIGIYGADEASGTYDFFAEIVFNDGEVEGETFDSDRNYNGDPDDDTIISDVSIDASGIGYVGYSHYIRNLGVVTSVSVANSYNLGAGSTTEPDYSEVNVDNIGSGTYPISRSIYMNIENYAFSTNDAIFDYLTFAFSSMGQNLLVNQTGYVALDDVSFAKSEMMLATRGALSSDFIADDTYGDLGGSEDVLYTSFADGCSDDSYTQFDLSGSSTVYPVAKVWAYNYIEWASHAGDCVAISVKDGGSSRGATEVCNGTVDMGDMSRGWKTSEAALLNSQDGLYRCTNSFNGSNLCLNVMQIELGVDGLTVFVASGTALAKCIEKAGGLTYTQLQTIFEKESSATYYSDIEGLEHCNETAGTISTYAAGDNSGTLSFFCEEIFGDDECTIADYFRSGTTASEDDDEITSGVRDNVGAIGFAGYAHYLREESGLYAVPLDSSGSGPYIAPAEDVIDDLSYPMTRPLYMNVRIADEDDIVTLMQNYLTFGLGTTMGQALLTEVIGYVALDSSSLDDSAEKGGNIYSVMEARNGRCFDWDCSVGRANYEDRYGDLGGTGKFEIPGAGSSCDNREDSFIISGSSTVYPLAKIWAVEFNECLMMGCNVIEVAGGGSSTGANDVCQSESDIGDMSRDWKKTETFEYEQDLFTQGCLNSGDDPAEPQLVTQIPLGYDGITVFVKKDSDVYDCINAVGGLSLGDLRWMYSDKTDSELQTEGAYVPTRSDADVTSRTWGELLSSCTGTPENEAIKIYGADELSGTYDFFSETIFGEDGFAVDDRGYMGSEDDDQIIDWVVNDEFGIGYVGYSHYIRNTDRVTAIAIAADTDKGADDSADVEYVEVTVETIDSGDYPISRPLYMNVDSFSFSRNDAIYNYLAFAFTDLGQELLVNQTGYVALPSEEFDAALAIVESRGALSAHYSNDYYGDLGGSVPQMYTSFASCGNGNGDDYTTIEITGSSTVYPVAKIWAYNYIEWASNRAECVRVNVTNGGSSRGYRDVCDDKVNIGDMSRDFKDGEATLVDDNEYDIYQCEREYTKDKCLYVMQLALGVDGLSVFVQAESDIAACIESRGGLTYDELSQIMSTEQSYSDILGTEDSNCRGTPSAYVPGDNSGTLAFFCEEILSDDDCSVNANFRDGTQSSEDDDDITNYVKLNGGAIGFAGYAHYLREAEGLYVISLAATEDDDFIAPTAETIDDKTYPVTRPLYMNVAYPDDSSLEEYLEDYILFGLNTTVGQGLMTEVLGYSALTDAERLTEVDKTGSIKSLLNEVAGGSETSCDVDDSNKDAADSIQVGLMVVCLIFAVVALLA